MLHARSLSLGLICLACTCCSVAETPAHPPLAFDATALTSSWVEIWNNYDLSQVDSLFLLDDRVTYFSSEKQGVIVGIEAGREHHIGFGFVAGGADKGTGLWLEDVTSTQFGQSAVVTGIWYFGRPDGTQQRGPVTIVYVLHEGEYRIAHMNFSNYLEAEAA